LRPGAGGLAFGMASTLRIEDESRAGAAPTGLTTTDLLLLLMALIWGVNFAVVKYGTGELLPLAFNSARITLAALTLSVVVLVGRQSLPGRRDAFALLALGALGNGLYQILFVEGIARTRAGDAALLIAAAPAFMAIIGWLRGTERTGPRGVIGILLSLCGIALVVFGDARPDASEGGGNATLLGDALLLGASLCWSLYSVLLKPYTERVEGLSLSAVTMLGGAVPMVLVSLPSIAATRWASIGPGAVGSIAYSGVLALVLAYLFWYRGVKVLGPTRTGMYANLQPVIALGVAWAALSEAPHVAQLAGAACIMAGLLLTRFTGRPAAEAHA
jgi:drug/metabolite transporter (DMT)-like permease